MATSYQRLVHGLKKFPGVGQRLAEKLAFHILEMPARDFDFFQQALREFRERTRACGECGLISEQDPCRICTNPTRDRRVLCLVERARDALTLERSGGYLGRYHVLGGLLSPVRGVQESDLRIPALLQRLTGEVNEILFAFEQTEEAEATIQVLTGYLRERPGLRLSRLAIGIPSGAGLDSIDDDTLKRSITHRTSLA